MLLLTRVSEWHYRTIQSITVVATRFHLQGQLRGSSQSGMFPSGEIDNATEFSIT